MWWTRLKALIVRRNCWRCCVTRRAATILIGPPIVQLVVFSYAATLEVRNVDVMLLNRDAGHWSEELVAAHRGLADVPAGHAHRQSAGGTRGDRPPERDCRHNEIGPDFSRNIEAGKPADLQVLLDGRRSNAAQIVSGYLTQIVRGAGRRDTGGPAEGGDGDRNRAAQLVQSKPDLSVVHGAEPDCQHRASDRAHRDRAVHRPRAGARHLRPVDGLSAPHA